MPQKIDIQDLVLRVMKRERDIDEIEFLLSKLIKFTELKPITWPTYYINLSRRSWS